MGRATHFHIFRTAAGFCAIGWSDRGVARFQLPTRTAEAAERLLLRRLPGARAASPAPVAGVIAAATDYFEGGRPDFSGLELDLDDVDPLFRSIYDALRHVGWGSTTTYGALAKQVDPGPEGARHVGEAMAKNPIPLIIPCHRVLAAGGKVGGFSAPGGAATKVRMLELEGVRLAPPEPAQASLPF
jgi:methylated-DNA-[protein]-cysteine S-methyltransferase